MITYEHVKDSSVLRYLTREARKEGLTKGRTEGRTEGRAEGRAETLVDVLAFTAKQRFPSLEVRDQLQRIHDADVLQALFVEFHKMKSAQAFLRRLAELTANQPTTHKRAKKNGTNKK